MVVSLPCFHLIRRCYPAAEIALLTNQPVESRAAPASNVLEGTGLVDRYLSYPIKTRRVDVLMDVRRSIHAFNPDLLVYLVTRPTLFLVVRDYLFFRLAGVKWGLGFPFLRDYRRSRRPVSKDGQWESEANRLARCIAALGPAETSRAESWDLHLSDKEKAEADKLLGWDKPNPGTPRRFVGFSVGTKQPIKDWGDANWRRVLMGLRNPEIGLVLIGAKEDRERSAEIAKGWPGPVVNLCGKVSLRESAAAIRRTELFLCHDSGPMHLAASVGARCIVVFSKHNLPGQWFPFGSGHKLFYPPPDANSIRAIQPAKVIESVSRLLAQHRMTAESSA